MARKTMRKTSIVGRAGLRKRPEEEKSQKACGSRGAYATPLATRFSGRLRNPAHRSQAFQLLGRHGATTDRPPALPGRAARPGAAGRPRPARQARGGPYQEWTHRPAVIARSSLESARPDAGEWIPGRH